MLNIFLCILNSVYYLNLWTFTMANVGKVVFLSDAVTQLDPAQVTNASPHMTDWNIFLCMNNQSPDDLYRILHFLMYTGIHWTNCMLKKGSLPHGSCLSWYPET